MINAPKKTAQSLLSKFAEQNSEGSSITTKRKNTETEQSPVDQQVESEVHPSKQARQGFRIGDALSEPSNSSRPFSRFMAQIERQQVDKATGRTFEQMFEIQRMKGRPLIIARCVCSRHAQGDDKQSKFVHPEFMDGNIVFEAMENEQLSSSIMYDRFGDFKPTGEQRKHVKEFTSRDVDFWSIDPFTKNYEKIANRAEVISSAARLSFAVDVLLSCDVKPLSEEDEEDHSLAYVVAGMYHCGYLVQKNQALAVTSVSLMKEANNPYCQANALRLGLDTDISIFSSLLELGVDPKSCDEQGLNIIDIVLSQKKSEKQQAASTILKQLGYL